MLVVAATPLGDPRDASPRLRETLAAADVIAAEDTRRLRRLLADLGVVPRGRVVSYWDAVERVRVEPLLADLRAGATVVVVSDAGMPTVSDPGYALVTAAAAEGLEVTVVPGPSAVTAALAVSGLPTDRFTFEGFLPRTRSARRRVLAGLRAERRTMVFFESPHRIVDALEDMAAEFGAHRRAAVCRELTKTYEEVRRGPLSELSSWAAGKRVRGEITVVVAGLTAGEGASHGDADDDGGVREATLAAAVVEVHRRIGAGERRSAATAEVARAYGVARRELYDATLADAPAPDPPGPDAPAPDATLADPPAPEAPAPDARPPTPPDPPH